MSALDIVRAAPATPCPPASRHTLPRDAWQAMAAAAAADGTVLAGLWADPARVHALLHRDGETVVASVVVEAGHYPALSPVHPAAARQERMIRDLWGHVAEGATDERPWLDHGRWPLAHPQSPRPGLPGGMVEPPAFPALDDTGLMQVPLGPIRGAVEEPAHLRLAVRDGRVVRAESRLGYAHKGTLALMRGKSPRAAAHFVARLAAEATVAHSLAFARAAEAAQAISVPPRAAALRGAMLAQERAAGHLDAIARMADLAGLTRLHGEAGWLCEQLRGAAEAAFGHRLMMDAVVPGGIATDVPPEGIVALGRCAATVLTGLPALDRQAAALLSRLDGLGTIPASAATGTDLGGDAAARCRRRLSGIASSLDSLGSILQDLPEGPVSVPLPAESGEGLGHAACLRGRVWHWLHLDHGQIAAAFPCDPGWKLWPLAEAAMAGQTAEEADMIRLSCGVPVAGLDL